MSYTEDYMNGKISTREYCKLRMADVLAQQKEELKEKFKKVGLDYDKLTQDQIDIIVEPSEAPENFYCDGELNAKQALDYWYEKMARFNIDAETRRKATRLNFGDKLMKRGVR